ncbi:MAG: ABC transporter permease [Deltaproteobacteria bacterium]|nr:ABC transporter permease [Deltaproteobacteria bacterium]
MLPEALRRSTALAYIETLLILRDKRSLGLAFLLPFLLLILFGSSLSYDVRNIPLAIWDQDRTPASRTLICAFRGSPYYRIIALRGGYPELIRDLDQGEALVAMVIPPDFGKRLDRGQEVQVQFILDGSDSTTAGISMGYIQGIMERYNLSLQQEKALRWVEIPVDLAIRVWFNPEMESRNFIVPGLIAVILMIIAALLTSLTLAREWETGTMETLLSLPLRPIEVVIGKMTPYFAMGMINISILLLASRFIFQIPIRGSIPLIYLFASVFTIGAMGLGIFISGVAKRQTLATQMAIITTYLPALLLSGFVFPIRNMPIPLQGISYLVPARYLIHALKGIFLKGIGLSILYPPLLLLLAFAIFVLWLAARQVPRQIKERRR